jgi:arginine decarboxylase
VNVVLTGDGYHLESTHRGNTVDDLLEYVSFTPEDLLASYRTKVSASDLDEGTRAAFLAALSEGLSGYTYLES